MQFPRNQDPACGFFVRYSKGGFHYFLVSSFLVFRFFPPCTDFTWHCIYIHCFFSRERENRAVFFLESVCTISGGRVSIFFNFSSPPFSSFSSPSPFHPLQNPLLALRPRARLTSYTLYIYMIESSCRKKFRHRCRGLRALCQYLDNIISALPRVNCRVLHRSRRTVKCAPSIMKDDPPANIIISINPNPSPSNSLKTLSATQPTGQSSTSSRPRFIRRKNSPGAKIGYHTGYSRRETLFSDKKGNNVIGG